jgi:hypothetical protein
LLAEQDVKDDYKNIDDTSTAIKIIIAFENLRTFGLPF